MSDFAGSSLEHHSCSYCNKKFHYNGATMVNYVDALKEKDNHESICSKRFEFEEKLKKKIYTIGKAVLEELEIHRSKMIITMEKSIFDDYLISNPHSICHISEEELTYFREHRND